MTIFTRVIVQPRGGGKPLEIFDSAEAPTTEVDTLLARYEKRFGEAIDTAFTEAPGVQGPVSIGWLFAVPDDFELPGPGEDYEMVLIPLIVDEDTLERVSLFMRMAEQRQEAQQLFDRGDLRALHIATLAQRDPSEEPDVSSSPPRSAQRSNDPSTAGASGSQETVSCSLCSTFAQKTGSTDPPIRSPNDWPGQEQVVGFQHLSADPPRQTTHGRYIGRRR